MSIPPSTPKISVIIPCFNQADALRETLARLVLQTLPILDFEVIVVDDGSADETKNFVSAYTGPYRLKFFSQEHKGAAVARNLGAKHALGDLLLFLDADMIAESDLFSEHLKNHLDFQDTIVVGRRKPWPPAQINLFSRIIDIDSNLDDSVNKYSAIPYNKALTCNLSIKTSDFWLLGGFDENFNRWEDIDFAYRAHMRSFSFLYNPNAEAYHNHPFSFAEFCKKIYSHNFVSLQVFKKHPSMIGHFSYLTDKRPIHWGEDPFSLILRKAARRLIAFKPVLFLLENLTTILEQRYANTSLLRFFYWKIIGSYELHGLRDGARQYQVNL